MARTKLRGKRKQRVAEVAKEVEENIQKQSEESKFELKTNSELFEIDTFGDEGKPQKKQKFPGVWSKKIIPDKLSKYEQKNIERKKLNIKQTVVKTNPKSKGKMKNVWGDDGKVLAEKPKRKFDDFVEPHVVKKKSELKRVPSTKYKVDTVEVATNGLSYHPEFEAHQNAIAEAVAIEMEKKDIVTEQNKPLRTGLSEETKQYIKATDENSSSEDEDDESNDVDLEELKQKIKKQDKKTRAERNRLSRRRMTELSEEKARSNKKLLKEINSAKTISDTLNKEAKDSEQKRKIIKMQKDSKLLEEPPLLFGGKEVKIIKKPIVSLSDELTGNLRSMKPRGSLILERYNSLHKRNMIEVGGKNKRKKRKTKRIESK